jgi:FlaA1/EpsC-like NDP-sugar epimerase
MNQSHAVSAADLLERDVLPTYTSSARNLIKGRVALVTGAGGSIGSEIVNQLSILGAESIICVDRDEYALYKLQLETTGTALLTDEKLILADIQNYRSLSGIMKKWKPSIVFHAAAVKHLPLLERSPDMAILTNVMGTENVVRACIENNVERMVNISTDKAATPISVLGKTKRLAEIITREYSDRGTLLSSVRFGNVFASRGSFIETLRWQAANNKQVTITDPDTTRYFMTIPQAACLVIEAAVLANTGQTYVLDMGEPVKIVDLVNRYMKLAGLPQPTVAHSGLRAGEKMHERLFDAKEEDVATQHPLISTVTVEASGEDVVANIQALYAMVSDVNTTRKGLHEELEYLINGAEHDEANDVGVVSAALAFAK